MTYWICFKRFLFAISFWRAFLWELTIKYLLKDLHTEGVALPLCRVVQRGVLPKGSGEQRTYRASSPTALVPTYSRNTRNHAAQCPHPPCVPIACGALLSDMAAAWSLALPVLHTQTCLIGTCSTAPIALFRFFCLRSLLPVSSLLNSGFGFLWMDSRFPFYISRLRVDAVPEEGSPWKEEKLRPSDYWLSTAPIVLIRSVSSNPLLKWEWVLSLSNRWSSIWGTMCLRSIHL